MAHHSVVCGLVDQLEDRLLCKQEVASSNLAQSTPNYKGMCLTGYGLSLDEPYSIKSRFESLKLH